MHIIAYFTLWIDYLFGPVNFHIFYILPTAIIGAVYGLVNFYYTAIFRPVYPNLKWETYDDVIFISLACMVALLHYWFCLFVAKTYKAGRTILFVDKDELKKANIDTNVIDSKDHEKVQ